MREKLSLYNSDIFVGNNSINYLTSYIKEKSPTKIFILVDSNTKNKCLPFLMKSVFGIKDSFVIEVAPGEISKSLDEVQKICNLLLYHEIDRSSLIINLGGGVICDLGGFVASIIKRGVSFINIPTTLLAQIDASIGGKVGVNFEKQKNQLGLFSNPNLVLICPVFLATLGIYEISTSYSEIIKYALIFDEKFWNKLKVFLPKKNSNLQAIIHRCVNIKISIVKRDYYDFTERRKLNFGHSIAHALEACYMDNKLHMPHGIAVFIGIICESYLSYKRATLTNKSLMHIVNLVLELFSPVYLDKKYDQKILDYIKSDKKNKNGILYFTLLNSIGTSIVNCHVPEKEVHNSLKFYRNICSI